MQDYVILCDDQGKPLGTVPKSEVHTDHTPLHLAFTGFLFRSNGDVLLQQRAHTKKTWPLMWTNSFCGHQKLDEDIRDTIHNRAAFELGITDANVQIMLPDFRYRCEKDGIVENEICPVFVGMTAQDPHPNADEVESYRWISWEEWLKIVEADDQNYAYWSKKETKELLEQEAFQTFLAQLKK